MKTLVVANWKMNPRSLAQAKSLFSEIQKGIKRVKKVEVVICPPFLYLLNLKSKILNLKLGAQNVFWRDSGAFTGEISPKQLKDAGCQYVIVGHSERRRIFKETDELIKKKIKAAKAVGFKPIVCAENPTQTRGLAQDLILAFEPVSAIGTDKAYSLAKAKMARESFSEFKIVLYGGSVNSQNAKDYIRKAGFQGLLAGAVSLKAEEFVKLVRNVDSLT